MCLPLLLSSPPLCGDFFIILAINFYICLYEKSRAKNVRWHCKPLRFLESFLKLFSRRVVAQVLLQEPQENDGGTMASG